MPNHAEMLKSTEKTIAGELKSDPSAYDNIYKELYNLRRQDTSEKVFRTDLGSINKDLQSLHLLPDLKIVESLSGNSGFAMQKIATPSAREKSSSDSNNSDRSVAYQQSIREPGSGSSSSGEGGGFQGNSPSTSSGESGSSSSGGGGGGGGGDGDGGGGGGSDSQIQENEDLPSDVPSGSLAAEIVNAGEDVGGKEDTSGLCLKGVLDSLQSIGIDLPRRAAAYQEAQDFAKDKSQFEEISAGSKLQPGDIIVHGKTASNPYGHIAIVLPDGKESSDHVANLVGTAVARDFGPSRVFRPIGQRTH